MKISLMLKMCIVIPLSFGIILKANCQESNVLLDCGNAKYFFYKSAINNLYININGRMKLINNRQNDTKTFYLLTPHPREFTWDPNNKPYSPMIEQSGGASWITFIAEKDGKFVISRRYESPSDLQVLHQCMDSPYGNYLPYQPKQLPNDSLLELLSTVDVRTAALKQSSMYAVLTYDIDGYQVVLDFPIELVNINPQISDPGQQWQAVSSRIPFYIGGNSSCDGVREGHIAIRDTLDTFEFVYLCQKSGINNKNDFNCTFETRGVVRIYTKKGLGT